MGCALATDIYWVGAKCQKSVAGRWKGREGEREGRGCRLPKSTLSLRGERERDAPSTCHKKQEDGAGINRLIDQAVGQGRPEIGTGFRLRTSVSWGCLIVDASLVARESVTKVVAGYHQNSASAA